MMTRKQREFSGFRGIPYALPPLGELRFEVSSKKRKKKKKGKKTKKTSVRLVLLVEKCSFPKINTVTFHFVFAVRTIDVSIT